ncbi:MAG: hypothetical protein L0220_28825, partial [Acidobacteria bacterium]|nr:hypothetical protein [Acidobacteriota bacterium]
MRKLFIITAVLLLSSFSKPSNAIQSSVSQEPITGDWTAKVKETDKGRMLWLSLTTVRDGRNNYSQSSFDLPLQDFSGLNPDANANVQFTLNREAGTVAFNGIFKDGKGVGDFRFTPSAAFIGAMRNLGYEDLSSEKLFAMAIHDVNTKFVSEMKALGYTNLSTGNLISFRIFKVN